MEIRYFSELNDDQLTTMAKKHFKFFSNHNSTLTLNGIIETFKNNYSNYDKLPYGLAIEEKNKIIGFCNIRLNALNHYKCNYPFICGIYIYEEFRNKGYGTLLINYAIDKIRKMGFTKVYLWTEEIPEYYEKLGFIYVDDILKNDKNGYAKLYMKEI